MAAIEIGTTGVAACEEGFEFIGIEKEKEYFQICGKRLATYTGELR